MILGIINKFGSGMCVDQEMIKKRHKMMIMIPMRVWIVRTFIIDVYRILIVDVLLKMNLIVLALCDFNASTNWLFFGGQVKIIVIKNNFQPIAGASFEQNNLLIFQLVLYIF